MVQIISPESVARKSRKDLQLPEWADTIVIDQLAKLLERVNKGASDEVTIQVIMERFAWLAAKAEESGFGPIPSLFQGAKSDINREWVEYYATQRNMDVTRVAEHAAICVEQQIERMQQSIAELKEIAATARYEPASDEPSIYGNNGGLQPSTEWLLWYSNKQGIGILQAHEAALKIMQQLDRELPRPRVIEAPEKWITEPEFKKAGIHRTVLSMKWVVWYKYFEKVHYLEAHLEGTKVTVQKY
jgi:hypothetical protein